LNLRAAEMWLCPLFGPIDGIEAKALAAGAFDVDSETIFGNRIILRVVDSHAFFGIAKAKQCGAVGNATGHRYFPRRMNRLVES